MMGRIILRTETYYCCNAPIPFNIMLIETVNPHAPVAQKVAGQCTFIAILVKRLFVRVDWTERLRDDSSTTD